MVDDYRSGRAASLAALGAALLLVLTACQGDPEVIAEPPGGADAAPTIAPPPSDPSPERVRMRDAADCPVTLPSPGGPPGVRPRDFFGHGATYGVEPLWVGGLWPKGIIAAERGFVEEDGSVGMKFGWWRGVPGTLEITGRRLDSTAPPLRSDVPPGYGAEGFQATGVYFPTEGCWEVTGTLGSSELTFVTFVIKRAAKWNA